jgi:hypothetical protein
MDTNEPTLEPVEGEGATSATDTSDNVAQPAESTDSVSDGDVAEAESALLAGKYKTPEELERGYKELESKLGQHDETRELAKMLEEQTGMSASQIRDYIAQQKQQQLVQQYRANPEMYNAQKIQELEAKIALQNEERELDKFLGENPEYTPHKDKILKLGLNLERDKPYADIAREYFGQARAQGQQDAYKKIETKKQTQATGVSQTPPGGKLTPEDMDRMTAAELEAILPWADTSNRL